MSVQNERLKLLEWAMGRFPAEMAAHAEETETMRVAYASGLWSTVHEASPSSMERYFKQLGLPLTKKDA